MIIFHPEAEVELKEASEWYTHQRTGLDSEFILSIDEAIERVKKDKLAFPLVYKDLRKCVVKRFPFIILFNFDDENIKIHAIFHSRRNPKIWKRRTAH